MGTDTIATRIPKKTKQRFKKIAEQQGKKVGDLLRELIEDTITRYTEKTPGPPSEAERQLEKLGLLEIHVFCMAIATLLRGKRDKTWKLIRLWVQINNLQRTIRKTFITTWPGLSPASIHR
ncbi:MAG: hypothetical protein DRO11_03290 [Methanobacteriota archaeon]|nr:MAG: hypothetical protein DRO11_03290 [Euryarchaeota archaeon]